MAIGKLIQKKKENIFFMLLKKLLFFRMDFRLSQESGASGPDGLLPVHRRRPVVRPRRQQDKETFHLQTRNEELAAGQFFTSTTNLSCSVLL